MPLGDGELQSTLQRALRERDLYLRLLELRARDDLASFLDEALAVLVEAAGAERGYLELDDGSVEGTPRWWRAQGFSDDELSAVRRQISSKIIAQALATGQVIETASAVDDARFHEARSVQMNRIRAVLCAPIGEPPVGVIYLQGQRGAGATFSPADRARAEAFARHFGPVAAQALAREASREAEDPTRPLRERLEASALVGRSPALAQVLAGIGVAAPVDVTVLVTGPTGSGKQLVAEVIHRSGPRRHGPLVTVSCAGASAEEIDAELFGAARKGRRSERTPGKVAAARGGTLVIDAIDEAPPEVQAKLARLVDGGVGDRAGRPADVRLIVTTAVELDGLVRAGTFRKDLRFRLQVLKIAVPGLRERREDILPLARHFCRAACARAGAPELGFAPSAIAALGVHEWPGNVRELANTVESAVTWALGTGATTIEQGHVFPAQNDASAEEPSWQEANRAFQQKFLAQVLDECEWNVSRAAKRLDLARSHVYNLIRGLGIRDF